MKIAITSAPASLKKKRKKKKKKSRGRISRVMPTWIEASSNGNGFDMKREENRSEKPKRRRRE
jgi:hypothetical protein